MPIPSRPRLFGPLTLLLLAGSTLPARAAPTPAPAPPALPAPVASVEGVSEYRLDNGLRVLLFPDPTKSSVMLNITYFVGSRHEGYGETGMAHLLEHLMFKGTPTTQNVPQALTQRGARSNGATSFDRTDYQETLPATEENLRWALGFEADRMVHSFIAQKDLDSEMTVVRNELEKNENDSMFVLHTHAMNTAYLWHNYGKTTIGARADLEHVPIERLQAFYKKYYRPDNAMLVLAGRFEPAQALAEVKKAFGPLKAPKEPLSPTYTEEPTQQGERRITLRRVGDVSMLNAVYHVPEGAHPDFAALNVLANVLSGTPSGRLYKALVETKKAASVFNVNWQLHDPGVVSFFTTVREGQSLDTARETLLATVEEATRTPFTVEEVERAKAALLSGIEQTLKDSELTALELSDWAATADWRLFFLHRDRIQAVTPADVTRVAAYYLKPSNRTLGEFIPTSKPDRAEMPPRADLTALRDYQGRAAMAPGELFDPSPENIESRVRRSQAGGVRLALLTKKTRGERVNVTLALHFGSLDSLKGRVDGAAEYVGELLMRGTQKHTREQLRDRLDQLRAEVNVSGSAVGATVTVEAPRASLPEVMTLVAEMLHEPALSEQEFALVRQKRLASLENQRSEPFYQGRIALQRALSPYPAGHPSYVPDYAESLALLKNPTLAQVRAFHHDFYGASRAELAAVGDFDAEALQKQVAELLGSWKSPAPYERVPALPYRPGGQSLTVETPDKANALYFAGEGLAVRDDAPDYPALVLGNFMLGGGFLNSRLATRVRQKDGLSYTVRSSLDAEALDPVGLFSTYAIYAPQNAARLEAAMREEVERALREGFRAEEVEQARTGLLGLRRQDRASDEKLARRLASFLFSERTLAYDAAFEQRMRALKPEDVRAALARVLDWKRVTVVKAGDFAGVGKKPAPPGTAP